jgi:hypothetical protein
MWRMSLLCALGIVLFLATCRLARRQSVQGEELGEDRIVNLLNDGFTSAPPALEFEPVPVEPIPARVRGGIQ